MVGPVDADVDEAEQVAEQAGAGRVPQCRQVGRPSGSCSSSTMIVMMMASTPSLNASRRLVRIAPGYQAAAYRSLR